MVFNVSYKDSETEILLSQICKGRYLLLIILCFALDLMSSFPFKN